MNGNLITDYPDEMQGRDPVAMAGLVFAQASSLADLGDEGHPRIGVEGKERLALVKQRRCRFEIGRSKHPKEPARSLDLRFVRIVINGLLR